MESQSETEAKTRPDGITKAYFRIFMLVASNFMRTLSFTILIVSFLYSCSTNSADIETKNNETKIDTNLTTKRNVVTTINNSDTLIVDKKSSIFFTLDTTEINKLKSETIEEDFYVGADDAMYYLSVARTFVDSVKLFRIEQSNKKFIKFVKLDKTQSVIKISQLNSLCGVYFFDPKKEPKFIDLTIVDEEYKKYFFK